MKKWLPGLICLVFYHTSIAQGESNAITFGQLSNELNSSNAINVNTVVQLDAELCLSSDTNSFSFNIIEHIVQYGGRAWLHYYLTPRLKFSAALGIWNNPEVAEAAQYNYLEFRSSVQVIRYFTARKATIMLKLVAEQRFVQEEDQTGFEYKPRIRFSPRLLYAFNANVIRARTYYGIFTPEIYMTPGTEPFFKIVRVTAGAGYNFTDDLGLELTYTSQTLYNTESRNAHTNSIAITLVLNNILFRHH